jgi:tetratricopeptide (TPR) repeat protein
LLLEGALSLFRVGYPTSFFIPSEQPGVVTTNMHFGWHYQQRGLTQPHPGLVPIDKPEGAIRVFVLGESAAMGMPDPSFGFARILEVMLRQCFPDHQIEVVNAAMRGINSHVVLPIMKECERLEPDVFVIYMGNNELTGLYAPRTPLAFLGGHPALIPLFHRVKQMRTAQLLRRVLGANPAAFEKKKEVPTAAFFESRRTALDDPQRAGVYRNFRSNLERICRCGLEAGADVLVSTVAVNLRDFPPLGSLHRDGLTAGQLEQWDRFYREGATFEIKGEAARAVASYRQAAELDDHYAELHFRLARSLLRTGERDEARRHFVLARDWDALQLRTDGRLNDLARAVAGEWSGPAPTTASAGPSVRLVETDAALAAGERCPDGIPGREFFYEHVHLNFDGDYEIAVTLLPAVVQTLLDRGFQPGTADAGQGTEDGAGKPSGLPGMESVRIPSRERCARVLAFTAWDEVNTAAAMVELTAKPPFTRQLEHAGRQAAAEKAIAAVTDHIDQQFIDRVIRDYRDALERRPNDWHLHYNLGTFLHQLERSQEAVAHFEYVVRTFPHVAPFRVLLGYALVRSGLRDQAIDQFREALRRDRGYEPAREGLEWARGTKQRAAR